MKTTLCRVEDIFDIEGRGLLITPDFPVPEEGWDDCEQLVVVQKPDGSEREMNARFSMSHFRITDPNVPLDSRWRIVMAFCDVDKSELPKQSLIRVSEGLAHKLAPKNSG